MNSSLLPLEAAPTHLLGDDGGGGGGGGAAESRKLATTYGSESSQQLVHVLLEALRLLNNDR